MQATSAANSPRNSKVNRNWCISPTVRPLVPVFSRGVVYVQHQIPRHHSPSNYKNRFKHRAHPPLPRTSFRKSCDGLVTATGFVFSLAICQTHDSGWTRCGTVSCTPASLLQYFCNPVQGVGQDRLDHITVLLQARQYRTREILLINGLGGLALSQKTAPSVRGWCLCLVGFSGFEIHRQSLLKNM